VRKLLRLALQAVIASTPEQEQNMRDFQTPTDDTSEGEVEERDDAFMWLAADHREFALLHECCPIQNTGLFANTLNPHQST